MTRTSWRDNFTRIVKGRAVAYAESDGVYRSDMPFENIHGNGGLLTTVGDLLRWNENFVEAKVGGAEFAHAMQVPGRLSDGGEHGYAYGLGIRDYKGIAEVSHSGTTASYRAFLARYPDPHVSVAMLCNAGNSMPRQTLHAVADLYLAGSLKPEPARAQVTVADAILDAVVGQYRNTERGDVVRIEREGNTLRLGDGTALLTLSSKRFTDGDGLVIEFDGKGGGTLDEGNGTITRIERFAAAKPTAAELETLASTYTSDDAEISITARVRDGSLELTRRPDSVFLLTPLYADAFDSELGTIIFRRDGTGRPVAFSVVRERVWDLRFER
jgi:hypothetical protein